MAHDTYQFPQQYSESDLRAQINAMPFPEKNEQEVAPFKPIKDIEKQIFSYRDAALALENKTKPKSFLASLVFRPGNTTIGKLIEEESILGGKLFGEGHRFWLDTKSGVTFENDVADWYHSQINPANPKNPIVLRFQTTPTSIHKLYEGREYAPTVQDMEILVKAIEAYSTAILPLYPLDNLINELQHEDPSDYNLAA